MPAWDSHETRRKPRTLVRGGGHFVTCHELVEWCYNQAMRYFDKTFFRFLFGFICLISLSIAVIAYARGLL